jgi:uncharacterized protein YdeI (YjbR/CyaY-like superfamily)
MGKKDARIDAYIAKQREFAQPILKHLRDVIHQGCPEVVETLKWSSPSFEYQGILCGFAAFKEHAAFGFWKHENLLGADRKGAMGSFGRLTSIDDLPSRKELLSLIKQAMKLNEDGVKPMWLERRKNKRPIPIPSALRSALAKNKKAKATYDAFTPSHKREYHEWIVEAKQEATRERRVAQAIEWMAAGKARNWKYM